MWHRARACSNNFKPHNPVTCFQNQQRYTSGLWKIKLHETDDWCLGLPPEMVQGCFGYRNMLQEWQHSHRNNDTKRQKVLAVLPKCLVRMGLTRLHCQSDKISTGRLCKGKDGSTYRNPRWVKENYHLLVGTSVNTLQGERKGWMRSKALSTHVKTEELPLPASMSVPTHSVCVSLVSHP